MTTYSRREVNRLLAAGLASAWSASSLAVPAATGLGQSSKLAYRIAFSSWCFHMQLWRGEMKARDLPGVARELGIDALEWTAKTFRSLEGGQALMFEAPPPDFFHSLRTASDDAGVSTKVFNVGGPFFLASGDKRQQQKALDFVLQYVEPAGILGADILRTELYFDGERKPGWQQQAMHNAVDGIHTLLEKTEGTGLTINVENHHGISSQPEWLADLVKAVDHSRFGLTVDTNNFRVDQDNPYDQDPNSIPRYVDRYQGLETLMPLANWVSAKFYAFDSTGYEISMDYPRILDIILRSGFSGYISVEYEGEGEPLAGVRKSIDMLRKLREHFGETEHKSARLTR
jgi:L-ribulose-5-phosphate 3-epimerase